MSFDQVGPRIKNLNNFIDGFRILQKYYKDFPLRIFGEMIVAADANMLQEDYHAMYTLGWKLTNHGWSWET